MDPTTEELIRQIDRLKRRLDRLVKPEIPLGPDALHAAFIGLEDNAGTDIEPAADDRIQVTDDGVINADASGNDLALSIDQSQISHDSIADVSEDDHHAAFIGLSDNADTSIDPAVDNRIQITDDGVINADASGNTLALSVDQSQISHDSISDVSEDDHHTAFVGLSDNADASIDPDDTDDRIQITDDGVINADASGNTLALSIDQSQISHDSIADVSEDDHHAAFIGLSDNADISIDPAVDNRIQVTDDGKVNADASGNTLALSIDEGQLVGGSIPAPGSDTEIIFNDGGVFGSDSDFTWDKTNNVLSLTSTNGIDINPGSDVDADLITVGVTDSPTFSWDESEDAFAFSAQKIRVNTTQAIFVPDQTDFSGTMIVGDGGGSLSHTSGTDGYNNTFIGLQAGAANTTGDDNTFIGRQAGQANTTGVNNTFIGYQAGGVNTTGNRNTFIGYQAGAANTEGERNTFIGYEAGEVNTTGNNNTFIGRQTGQANTIGGNNTFIGYEAGEANTTGDDNTFIGRQAGQANTTGVNNTFIGHRAGANETGSDRLYIANSDTSTPLVGGDFANNQLGINVAIGSLAATLHVDQSSLTAATPVLYLDQADVSEQLIHGSSDGNDVDINIITLDVTGTPTFWWDESEDRFVLNKDLDVNGVVISDLSDFGGLTPDDGNFIVGDGANWITESGNTARTSLGLGTGDSPTFAGLTVDGGNVDITRDGANSQLTQTSYGAVPLFQGRFARGTEASPSAVQADDNLYGIAARGYGSTGFSANNRAKLNFIAAENWTDAAQGASIELRITKIGTASATTLMTIGDTVAGGTGVIIDADNGNDPLYVTRTGSTNQAGKMYVDDFNLVIESVQDESTGTYGGFHFVMDDGADTAEFKIDYGSQIFTVDGATGDVGINVSSMSAQLHVDQSSATGAKPVLYLDQADVSEQAIFVSYDGADVDMSIIELDVTGSPIFGWDESEDSFTLNKGLDVTGSVDATTVTGANVTSGADPGHTHTGSSVGSISHDTDLVDVSADDHHSQQHDITGADHTASGLTTGHVIRATGATTFAWQQLQHTDLGALQPDDHHDEDHASRHITGAADEIDGDQIDIDWTPSNYTPSTSPAEASNVDHLTAHLAGIDDELGTLGSAASPGGSDTQVQFNDGGSFAGDADFTWDKTNNVLSLTSTNGIDINPGSDTDADLITVGVTGSPTFWWDESEDSFVFSHGVLVGDTDGIDINPGSDTDADLITVGVTGTPTFGWDESEDAFTFTHGILVGDADGIDVNPGSDVDADLITVGVTGTPTVSWDESEDSFQFSHDIRLPEQSIFFGAGATPSQDRIDGSTTGTITITTSGTDRLVVDSVGVRLQSGTKVNDIDTVPANNDNALITSGGVWDHTNASAGVHGLAANEYVLGSDVSGHKVEAGTESATTATSYTPEYSGNVTVTFPLAFSATPVVVGITAQDRSVCPGGGCTSIGTTSFTFRGHADTSTTVSYGWIAKGA